MTTPQPNTPKRDPLTTVLMVGTSIFGGGTALYMILQLVREQPAQAFTLLQSWGPGFLLALFIAYALNKLLGKALEIFAQSSASSAAAVDRVAIQMQSIAEATEAQALAMQTTANKDDRDKQEMEILIGVINSKVEQVMDEQRQGNRALQRIEDALKINRPSESEKTQ